MISRLSGRLAAKSPEEIVVDVGGVGYQVLVSLQTYARLAEEGAPIELFVHTHVREDALQLFGFSARSERTLFRLLQEVSGIGPKLALNILSGLPAGDLRRALLEGDLGRLQAIPGVGRKTAERMVVELREKKGLLDGDDPRAPEAQAAGTTSHHDVVEALVNLGYRRPDAERAVDAAVRAGKVTFEDVVREALKGLGR